MVLLWYNISMENRDEIKQKIKSMNDDELVDFYTDLYMNNKNLETELNWYKEQILLLKKQRFSSSSEKEQIVCGQLMLFNEAEDIHDHPQEEKAEPKPEPKSKKRKKSREADYSKLPAKVVEHDIKEKHCEVCGSEMKELAPQIIEVLKYQPARYYVERHIVHQYICPNCTDENLEAEITVAQGAPKRLIKGSVVSPSVVSGIVFNKYVSGTPLYRQEQELKRKKIEINRATMSNWLMKSGKLLEPIYEGMTEELRKQKHLHMDETTVVVLEDKKNEDREKSYMWMMASGKHEKKQAVIYSYHKSREHEYAKDMIGAEYAGSIHCDGYEAYHKLEKATIMGCVVHMRRKFVEAMEVNPLHKQAKEMTQKQLKCFCESHPSYGNIVHIVQGIRKLFQYEKEYAKKGYDKRTIEKKRQEEQEPILDELFECMEKHRGEYSMKSKMGIALTYALNQKEYLKNYLYDGEAEISNNRGERYIKPFVMGRKAWLFSNTRSGAKMSAIYYSLIESAKANHLDIEAYLTYILEEIKEHGGETDYGKLMPYSEELPDIIRVK